MLLYYFSAAILSAKIPILLDFHNLAVSVVGHVLAGGSSTNRNKIGETTARHICDSLLCLGRVSCV